MKVLRSIKLVGIVLNYVGPVPKLVGQFPIFFLIYYFSDKVNLAISWTKRGFPFSSLSISESSHGGTGVAHWPPPPRADARGPHTAVASMRIRRRRVPGSFWSGRPWRSPCACSAAWRDSKQSLASSPIPVPMVENPRRPSPPCCSLLLARTHGCQGSHRSMTKTTCNWKE